MGFVQKLKARLGERYDVLREVSVAFQLGQVSPACAGAARTCTLVN
jgi:hypothetical protein